MSPTQSGTERLDWLNTRLASLRNQIDELHRCTAEEDQALVQSIRAIVRREIHTALTQAYIDDRAARARFDRVFGE